MCINKHLLKVIQTSSGNTLLILLTVLYRGQGSTTRMKINYRLLFSELFTTTSFIDGEWGERVYLYTDWQQDTSVQYLRKQHYWLKLNVVQPYDLSSKQRSLCAELRSGISPFTVWLEDMSVKRKKSRFVRCVVLTIQNTSSMLSFLLWTARCFV